MAKKPKVLTYQQAYDLALRAGSRFPAVVAAQFALETDWGRKTANAKNNLFNIKWNDAAAKRLRDRGIKVTRASKGATDNMTGSYDHYMQFESVQDAFIGYQNFIETNPRYGKALNANTAQEYLEGIKAAGYAEDPKYIESINKIATGAGFDLTKEARYSDDQIAEVRKKAGVLIDQEKEKGGAVKDNIPQPKNYNTPMNRANIMKSIDFSQSTVNDRQFDRMEMFLGKHIEDGSTPVTTAPEDIIAKAALDTVDPETLEAGPDLPDPIDPINDIPAPEQPINQIQQYDGGVQPNGRKSTFTRTEDLQAQGNTYNPLNLF